MPESVYGASLSDEESLAGELAAQKTPVAPVGAGGRASPSTGSEGSGRGNTVEEELCDDAHSTGASGKSGPTDYDEDSEDDEEVGEAKGAGDAGEAGEGEAGEAGEAEDDAESGDAEEDVIDVAADVAAWEQQRYDEENKAAAEARRRAAEAAEESDCSVEPTRIRKKHHPGKGRSNGKEPAVSRSSKGTMPPPQGKPWLSRTGGEQKDNRRNNKESRPWKRGVGKRGGEAGSSSSGFSNLGDLGGLDPPLTRNDRHFHDAFQRGQSYNCNQSESGSEQSQKEIEAEEDLERALFSDTGDTSSQTGSESSSQSLKVPGQNKQKKPGHRRTHGHGSSSAAAAGAGGGGDPTFEAMGDAELSILKASASVVIPAFGRYKSQWDSTRFHHWNTPAKNSTRAVSLASVLSFCFASTSKGFLSGNHEEVSRAKQDDSEQSQEEGGDKKKDPGPSRVHRYTFMDGPNNEQSSPMFTIAYEELYNEALDQVTAVRIWKLVWDPSHSDSALCRKLLDENQAMNSNAGMAHQSNTSRRKNLVAEQKQARLQANPRSDNQLENYAGTQYVSIQNEQVWCDRLIHYGGRNMHNEGRQFFDETKLPKGLLNARILGKGDGEGGTHPLAPEYVFNAKRPAALCAGTVDFDTNQVLDIHPDFLDVSKYFDGDVFTVPRVSHKKGGFFFMTSPYVNNPFEAALPRPVYGSVGAGPHLLNLYKEQFYDEVQSRGGTNASLNDCFNNMMTDQDPESVEMAKQMSQHVIAFDSIDLSEKERESLRHYGDKDGSDNFVIEPRQAIKDIQQQTNRVQAKLVQPWKREQSRKINEMQRRAQEMAYDANGPDYHLGYYMPEMEGVRALEKRVNQQHCDVMKDAISLHLRLIESAFSSKSERACIPQGYIAMWDGLQRELEKMPNKTASVAWAHGFRLSADDMSSFSHMYLWVAQFFEVDCFVEGRDRRILEEIFLHAFEQYADVTFVLLLCGSKGNGKTLRTERAMAVFPENWMVMGGPASQKAGMNGQSDSTNGKNVIYDEMVDELCDSDGSDRLEYWKQIVLKREYTLSRTCQIKNSDGTDSHKTMMLRTPHDETHLICTNYGMAFTKNGDPSDTKTAMIDRSVAHLVRSIGTNAHTDSEFRLHLSKPEQQRKLSIFRILVCLMGATRLAIKNVPAFQPSLAYAAKMFDYMDNEILVKQYNLPKRTPRKSLKREENLKTMCVMKAVADVFIFQQPACEFPAGRMGDDGKPQKFEITMLYDVIRQLRATPELCFMAWSQSLDYNIGTCSHTFAAMTAINEHFGMNVNDWVKVPVEKPAPQVPNMPSAQPGGTQLHLASREQCNSDIEFERQQQAVRDLHAARNPRSSDVTLHPALSLGGLTREQRTKMLESTERQRQCTSLYRHVCMMNGNSGLKMDNPKTLIEQIMKGQEMPQDWEVLGQVEPEQVSPAPRPRGPPEERVNAIPLWASCILFDSVGAASLYEFRHLKGWCHGDAVDCGSFHNPLMTKNVFDFSERRASGASRFNIAWLRKEAKNGWYECARSMHARNNLTCKLFDLPVNSLKDILYLMSTVDNYRRCTETPTMDTGCGILDAFTDAMGTPILEEGSGKVSLRGSFDVRPDGTCVARDSKEEFADGRAPERHPYSGIHNTDMQRRLDYVVQKCRLPAMVAAVSNNVTESAPVRIIGDGENQSIELSLSAALEHSRLLYESTLRCSLQPGLDGEHERFANNSNAPTSLSMDTSKIEQRSDEHCTKLPFSYDLVNMSITLDVTSRLYNSDAVSYLSLFNRDYADLGFKMTTSELPHTTTRFVGLEETTNRKFISLPPRCTRKLGAHIFEVGDQERKGIEAHRNYVHLHLALGRTPTEREIRDNNSSIAGARSMSGIQGDGFNFRTYRLHCLATLKERGMICGRTDDLVGVITDDATSLRYRVGELAAKKIQEIAESQVDVDRIERALELEDFASEEEKEDARARLVAEEKSCLYATMELPDDLNGLRRYAHISSGTNVKLSFHNERKDVEEARKKRQEENKRDFRSFSALDEFEDDDQVVDGTLPRRRISNSGIHDVRFNRL